jgi:hypothetical protein
LQNLHYRLLDKPIQHRGDAKLSHPSVRFGDFHPSYRLRLIGPVQQLFPDGWPVLFQVSRKVMNGHAVHAGTPLVGLDSFQCLLAVFPLADFLHQLFGNSWAFDPALSRRRFGPFRKALRGFTPILLHEGQH